MTEHNTISETERLVQRFVDQELSADERVAFLSRLVRESSLRERTLELEQLVANTAHLARPAVPHDFVARVMERTEAAPSIATRLMALLTVPRQLQWNLAGAAALACLVIASVWMTGTLLSGRGGSSSSSPTASAVSVNAANASAKVLVRLVVLQPEAKSVQVAGDFNGWNPTVTPLAQAPNGAWTVTLELNPGRYAYQFVVNGDQWMVDPFATEQSDDGFGSRNAVLDLTGSASEVVLPEKVL